MRLRLLLILRVDLVFAEAHTLIGDVFELAYLAAGGLTGDCLDVALGFKELVELGGGHRGSYLAEQVSRRFENPLRWNILRYGESIRLGNALIEAELRCFAQTQVMGYSFGKVNLRLHELELRVSGNCSAAFEFFPTVNDFLSENCVITRCED